MAVEIEENGESSRSVPASPPGPGNSSQHDAESEENPEPFGSDVECAVCMRLLLDPISTRCGHNFCKRCLETSLGYRGQCPLCRSILISGGVSNLLLARIIERDYPVATKLRRREELRALEALESDEREERRARAALLGVAPLVPIVGSSACPQPLFPGETRIVHLSLGWRVVIHHAMEGNAALALLLDSVILPEPGQRPTSGVIGTLAAIEGSSQSETAIIVVLKGKFRVRFQAPNSDREGLSQEGSPTAPTPVSGLGAGAPPPLQQTSEGYYVGGYELVFDQCADSGFDERGTVESNNIEEPTGNAEQSPPATHRLQAAGDALRLSVEAKVNALSQAERSMFTRKFGSIPRIPSPASSVFFEEFSFRVASMLIADAEERWTWMNDFDTYTRMERLRMHMLSRGARQPLDLGIGSGGIFEYLRLDSSRSSLVFLVGVIVLLITRWYILHSPVW